MSLSLCLYVCLASYVWQLAKAAPALACYSLPASGGETLRIAGNQHSFNTVTGIDRLKSLYQAPVNEGFSCVKDTQDSEAQTFGLLVTQLLEQSKDGSTELLGLETIDNWKAFAKHYQEITGGKIGSLKGWLEQNNAAQRPELANGVSDLEWLFQRAGSQQGVWWKSSQLTKWREANYDWKSMVRVGDQLQFGQTMKKFDWSKDRTKYIKKNLIRLLESGRWTTSLLDSMFGGRNGVEASMEFQALQAIGDDNLMYETRIGEIYRQIFNKMDQYQGDRDKLPDHLKSDLYLLGLLRGKVEKTTSGFQYVVATPAYTVRILKSLDGRELSTGFRSKSRGRPPTEKYEPIETRRALGSAPLNTSLKKSPKTSTTNIFYECSHGSRLTSPWAIPVNAWQKLSEVLNKKIMYKGGNLQN